MINQDSIIDQDSNGLLMDVSNMDFLNDLDNRPSNSKNENSEDGLDQSLISNGSEEELYHRDSITGDLVMNLAKKDELPLRKGDSGKLKLKLSNLGGYNLAYVTGKENEMLYPVSIPNMDNNKQYYKYITSLFQIYQDLGEHRSYNIPTIGVINSSYQEQHIASVNLALEATFSELEYFLNEIKDEKVSIDRYMNLEDSMIILQCLKTIYFTLDSPDEEQKRENFIVGLIEWVNRSDGEPNSQYINHVFDTDNSEKPVFQTNLFWRLLNQLLLRGLFEQAVGCIEKSRILSSLKDICQVSYNALSDLSTLLKHYPMDSDESFREWKAMVLELNQTFSNSETNVSGELRDSIEDTLLLVGGDRFKILNYSKTWYESFCGFILYYIPTLELADEYLKLSVERNAIDITSNWEECCASIIKGNVYSIFPVLESLDNCTATFAAAICEAKGLLRNLFTGEDEDIELLSQHEEDHVFTDLLSQKNGIAYYMINNLAFELCSYDNKDLWPIAIGLITFVPVINSGAKRMTIGELLQHYPYQTNDDIEWLLSVCAQWKLPYVTKSLFTKLGNSMMYEGKTIEAITNFSRAGRFDLVKQYSWTLFEASVVTGKPLEDEVLTAIVQGNEQSLDESGMMTEDILNSLVTNAMKQTLSPYAVLFRFYEEIEEQNWPVALDLLVELITFKYLPDHYLVLLVTKFLFPIFLEDDSKLIGEAMVISIIEAIELKWNSENKKSQNVYNAVLEADETLEKTLGDSLDDALKTIRTKLNYKLCQEFM
ncbi:similar to Saccharomyces cerevisiae YJR042W NUP85 Subunit of the Nup84p subcomplex of the nuclear pore complex (NPC) [Maudiozyma barnettii]|uniref:Nuclear pore complex protein Nup85 n=1 Tax=Maudiozyma barnettii TaxID=61262 RepID=A0A8H2ZIC8_9SACH|nr:Nup85p [Kazachstania barnettii]CAB4255773.1 similar to Saccharomyces cerevisiae YJR042W NUP85 Subunit of the Nup84p subcomplex of the nuclear pore complex (NPC) [Kazachstania barnettii]CAD1784334.1 similar to Saccharomyces cerevisiae YJR042W NUP85 Subunit of the Nup84p subcomplex of the nuclear pore complex (NPC) [Kazachstania barnettii]